MPDKGFANWLRGVGMFAQIHGDPEALSAFIGVIIGVHRRSPP
jgi:hypothetical protein